MKIGIPEIETHYFSRWVFLRLLGIIYFVAFLSIGVQVTGLIGSKGILPAGEFLDMIHAWAGKAAFRFLPTVFWFNSSNFFLQFICFFGVFLSILFIFGLAPTFLAAVLWFLYLSVYNVGQDFLSFQWDILLLETGFLAIFFTPLTGKGGDRFSPPSKIVLFLFWWLLFRLMFSSGYVKLASGDEAWRSLTALTYHYRTQPIPTPIGWYAHQLPEWFQKCSVLVMFFIELVVPFFIFISRWFRRIACVLLIFLQGLIVLTGNYGIFNWLTIALSLLLLDDAAWPKFLREEILPEERIVDVPLRRRWSKWVTVTIGFFIVIQSVIVSGKRLAILPFSISSKFMTIENYLAPFHITGTYGLFAVMTTKRPEIIIEGSNDNVHWSAYEFKYKSGALDRKLPFVAPYMPRLDWQMWFAALGSYQSIPWFSNLLKRLLEGSPDVLRLLESDPITVAPPKYIRASLYDYRFTDFADHNKTGHWWRRRFIRSYHPAISLEGEVPPPVVVNVSKRA